MSQPPRTARYGQTHARKERRAPRGAPGSTRWLKGLLARPVALERRDGQLHLTLVERRRPPEVIEQQSRSQLRDDVTARVLNRCATREVAVYRHLLVALDVLVKKGWEGVGAMTSVVLRKALMQARLLKDQEPCSAVDHLIERLQVLHVAAGLREDRARGLPSPDLSDHAEVSEVSHEEFEARQRAWVRTVSPAVSSDGQDD
jgi:hypothetical protein